MLARFIARSNSIARDPAPVEMQPQTPAPEAVHAQPSLKDEAAPLFDQIEQDLRALVSGVQQASLEVGRAVQEANASLTGIRTRTHGLASQTEDVNATATVLA